MSGKETKSQADFTFETVAILCSCLNNCTVTKAQYEMMSALDGTRTANAFQHQFRAVLKRARELKAKTDSGDTTMKPVEAEHKKGKAKKDGTVTSGKGTKNGKGDEKGTKRCELFRVLSTCLMTNTICHSTCR